MNKKYAIKGLALAVVAIAVFTIGFQKTAVHSPSTWTPQAFAAPADCGGPNQPKCPEQTPSYDMTRMLDDIAKLALWSQRLFQPMIHFFAFNIGNFLGSDYIYEGKMGEMLHSIWVVSRNIVNILFVLILLGLALKEIFGIGQESSDLKTTIGKFALLLIAVNFTWLASKVILDASNVATNVVFAIPSGVIGQGTTVAQKADACDIGLVGAEKELRAIGMCYPTRIYAPVDADQALNMTEAQCNTEKIDGLYDNVELEAQGEISGLKGSGNEKSFTPKDSYTTYEVDPTTGKPKATGGSEPLKSPFDLRKSITYCWENLDITKFQANTASIYLTYGMAKIQNIIPQGKINLVSMSVGVLFSFILMLAYLGSLAALFIALIIRMGFLWIFVAFSPFLVILYYLGIGQGGEDSYTDYKAFINWAFVPAKVAVFFTVAFLMVVAGQAVTLSDLTFFDRVNKMGNTTVKIIGARSLIGGVGEIQQFIWYLITVAILWIGTFSVLGKLKVAGEIANKINAMGTKAAGWVGSLPYKASIIPVKDEKSGKSFSSLQSILKPTTDYDRQNALDSKFSKLHSKFSTGADGEGGNLAKRINNVTEGDNLFFYNTLREGGMDNKEILNSIGRIDLFLKERGANEAATKYTLEYLKAMASGKTVPKPPSATAAPAADEAAKKAAEAKEADAKKAAGDAAKPK